MSGGNNPGQYVPYVKIRDFINNAKVVTSDADLVKYYSDRVIFVLSHGSFPSPQNLVVVPEGVSVQFSSILGSTFMAGMDFSWQGTNWAAESNALGARLRKESEVFWEECIPMFNKNLNNIYPGFNYAFVDFLHNQVLNVVRDDIVKTSIEYYTKGIETKNTNALRDLRVKLKAAKGEAMKKMQSFVQKYQDLEKKESATPKSCMEFDKILTSGAPLNLESLQGYQLRYVFFRCIQLLSMFDIVDKDFALTAILLEEEHVFKFYDTPSKVFQQEVFKSGNWPSMLQEAWSYQSETTSTPKGSGIYRSNSMCPLTTISFRSSKDAPDEPAAEYLYSLHYDSGTSKWSLAMYKIGPTSGMAYSTNVADVLDLLLHKGVKNFRLSIGTCLNFNPLPPMYAISGCLGRLSLGIQLKGKPGRPTPVPRRRGSIRIHYGEDEAERKPYAKVRPPGIDIERDDYVPRSNEPQDSRYALTNVCDITLRFETALQQTNVMNVMSAWIRTFGKVEAVRKKYLDKMFTPDEQKQIAEYMSQVFPKTMKSKKIHPEEIVQRKGFFKGRSAQDWYWGDYKDELKWLVDNSIDTGMIALAKRKPIEIWFFAFTTFAQLTQRDFVLDPPRGPPPKGGSGGVVRLELEHLSFIPLQTDAFYALRPKDIPSLEFGLGLSSTGLEREQKYFNEYYDTSLLAPLTPCIIVLLGQCLDHPMDPPGKPLSKTEFRIDRTKLSNLVNEARKIAPNPDAKNEDVKVRGILEFLLKVLKVLM